MPAKDSKDKRDRNASPNSKLKVKRARRRIYETVPNGSPPAGFAQEECDRKREDALQRKIRQNTVTVIETAISKDVELRYAAMNIAKERITKVNEH